MKLQLCWALVLCTFLLSNTAFSQDAKELVAQAKNDMLSKVYGPAAEKLKRAAQMDSNNPEIYYLMGKCYHKMGGKEKRVLAIQNLEKSVELDENNFEALELLSNIYGDSKRGLKKAISNLEKAYSVQQDPDIKLAYKLRIINDIYSVRAYKYAEKHIKDALELAPDNFDLQFLAAQYYNVVGDYENAIKMMEGIITNVPEVEGNEQYFYELGYAYFFNKQYDKANEQLEKIKQGPYSRQKKQFEPDFLIQVANSYFKVYEYERADEYRTITLAIDPSNTQAIELQSRLAKVQGDFSAQISALEQTIDAGNASEEKYEELTRLYYITKDYQSAMGTADRYLKTNMRDLKMNFMRAACEYQTKAPSTGAQTLSDAIKSPKLSPDQKAIFGLMLSMIYRNAEDLKSAMQYLKYPYRNKEFNAVARVEKELIFRLRQGGSIDDEDEGMEEDEDIEDDE